MATKTSIQLINNTYSWIDNPDINQEDLMTHTEFLEAIKGLNFNIAVSWDLLPGRIIKLDRYYEMLIWTWLINLYYYNGKCPHHFYCSRIVPLVKRLILLERQII